MDVPSLECSSQVEWSFEKPGLVQGVPAQGREVRTR